MKLILMLDGISVPNVVLSEVMKEVPRYIESDRIDEIILHGPGRYDTEFIKRLKSLFPDVALVHRPAYIGDYSRNLTSWDKLVRDDIRAFTQQQYFVVIALVSFPHSVWCAYGHSSNYTDDAYIRAASGIVRQQLNFRRIHIPNEYWKRS